MLTFLLAAAAVVAVALVATRNPSVSRGMLVVFFVASFNHGLVERLAEGRLDNLTRVLQGGLFIALVLAAVLGGRRWRSPHRNGVWVVVALVAAASILNWRGDVFFTLNGFRLTGLYLMAPLVTWRMRGRPDWLLRVITLTSAPSLVLGYRQALFGLTPAEQAQVSSARATFQVGDQVRLLGGASTGQEFSLLLILLTAVGCVMVVRRGPEDRSRIWSAYLVAVILLQFVALQRSALVASLLVLVAAFWWFLRGRRGRVLIALLLAGPALAFVFLVGLSVFGARSDTAITRGLSVLSFGGDDSIALRTSTVWPRATEAISEHPLTGWGAGAAGAPTLKDPEKSPLGALVTDNLFLHVAVQYGVLTAVALVFLLIRLATLGLKSAPSATAARAGGLALIGLLVAGLVGSYLSIFDITAPILMLAGTAQTGRASPIRPPRGEGARP